MEAIKQKTWPLDSKTISNLIVVVVGISFFFLLYRFDEARAKVAMVMNVLSPFIVGFVIAYLLNTPTKFLERKVFKEAKYRRALSIVTVYLLAVIIVAILLNLILPQVWSSAMELVNKMPGYVDGLNGAVQELVVRFNIDAEGLTDLVVSYRDLMNRVTEVAATAVPQILNFGVAVGSGVVTAVTALIASIYMLSGKDRLMPQLKKLIYAVAPTEKASWFLRVCSQANNVFVGFINGKLIDSAIIGVLCFLLSSLLQVPYAILVSVIIGVTNIIPFFGPIIGAVPCLMILLIVDPLGALKFGILIIVLQQFDGNVLRPKILGDSTGLSAIWVLVAIVVGGGLFGFAGMLLGVPTFAVLYALVREWANHRLEKKGIDGDGRPVEAGSEPEKKG